jgi:hypothetical protein
MAAIHGPCHYNSAKRMCAAITAWLVQYQQGPALHAATELKVLIKDDDFWTNDL